MRTRASSPIYLLVKVCLPSRKFITFQVTSLLHFVRENAPADFKIETEIIYFSTSLGIGNI